MQYFERDNKQMTGMPQEQLEAMYPMTYHIINPVVENTCDMMESAYGQMYTPTRKQLENMISDVYDKVEADVDVATQQSPMEKERQFYGGGRRLLRDFIGAMLVGSLIRRRRPFYGYPGYYGGYPSHYGGYPGYFGGYPYY